VGLGWRLAAVLSCRKRLEWGWREKLQGVFYRALGEIGADLHRARYSLFAYTLAPLGAKAGADGLRSRSGMWQLGFSSAVPEAVEAVERFLGGEGSFSAGSAVFRLEALYREAISGAEFGVADCVLVIGRDRSGFLAPGEPGYLEAVKAALAARWKWCGGDPGAAEAVEVAFAGPPWRKLAQYRGRDLLCFGGAVLISGPPELRRFARLVGLGHKPSCGFGYVLG
jgi:hypothetical protein